MKHIAAVLLSALILWNIPGTAQAVNSIHLQDENEHTGVRITITPNTDAEAAPEMLFTGDLPEREELEALCARIPGARLTWKPNAGIAAAQLEAGLASADLLCRVDLCSTALPEETVRELDAKYEQISLVYEVTVLGRQFPVDTEELDFSDIPVTNTAEIENAMHLFPNLKKVVMCRCGLSNEAMDALNQKYEDVQFVWEITFGRYTVRTDTKVFAPVTQGEIVLWGDELNNIDDIRYCRDVECIDLGHHGVKDISYLAGLQNLKYLILGCTEVSDISPLATCPNLIFLEIFLSNVTDISPLLECKKLEDLNAGHQRNIDVEPLKQMTWLKNLWMSDCWNVMKQLEGYLPDTRTQFLAFGSTDAGWRQLPNYYAMRDLMGMPYLLA